MTKNAISYIALSLATRQKFGQNDIFILINLVKEKDKIKNMLYYSDAVIVLEWFVFCCWNIIIKINWHIGVKILWCCVDMFMLCC